MGQWMGALLALGLGALLGVAHGDEASATASGSAEAAAAASASGIGSGSEAAPATSAAPAEEAPPMASPENQGRYQRCMADAGQDRDKRKICRAERLGRRAARERRVKALRRAWAEARKAVKPALAQCRRFRDKEGARAIGAWLKAGDAWAKALARWRQTGGVIAWQAPAPFAPCKEQEKPKKKGAKAAAGAAAGAEGPQSP